MIKAAYQHRRRKHNAARVMISSAQAYAGVNRVVTSARCAALRRSALKTSSARAARMQRAKRSIIIKRRHLGITLRHRKRQAAYHGEAWPRYYQRMWRKQQNAYDNKRTAYGIIVARASSDDRSSIGSVIDNERVYQQLSRNALLAHAA